MDFLNWLENNRDVDLQRLSSAEKDAAASAFIGDCRLKSIVIVGISEYMLDDKHLAKAMLLDDKEAGAYLKDCIYACFESEMIDAIEAYSRYCIGSDWLSIVLEELIHD